MWKYSHYLKVELVFFSLKNFKTFLETIFFKNSTSKCYIFESFALLRLGEVSIDPKFYLVFGSGHNSVPQKWNFFRFTYTYFKNGNLRSSVAPVPGKIDICNH